MKDNHSPLGRAYTAVRTLPPGEVHWCAVIIARVHQGERPGCACRICTAVLAAAGRNEFGPVNPRKESVEQVPEQQARPAHSYSGGAI